MQNPISSKARGWIYVIGIVVGAAAVIVAPLFTALGIPDAWTAVTTGLVGVVTMLSSTLSRANLTGPDETGTTDTPTE